MTALETAPGEVIEVRPLGPALAGTASSTLVKAPNLEVRRLVLPRGREVPTHTAPGEITVQCLEGRITFTAEGITHTLEAGQMLYLAPEVPHSLVGLEDSSVLVTKLLPTDRSAS